MLFSQLLISIAISQLNLGKTVDHDVGSQSILRNFLREPVEFGLWLINWMDLGCHPLLAVPTNSPWMRYDFEQRRITHRFNADHRRARWNNFLRLRIKWDWEKVFNYPSGVSSNPRLDFGVLRWEFDAADHVQVSEWRGGWWNLHGCSSICVGNIRRSVRKFIEDCNLYSRNSWQPFEFLSVRGRLGSTLVLFFGIGLLMSYVFGAFLPYYVVPWVSIPSSILFLLGFWRVPETPLYLLKSRKFEVTSGSFNLISNIQAILNFLGSRKFAEILSWNSSLCVPRHPKYWDRNAIIDSFTQR